MSYSKEMCVFLLSNPQMIEEDSLTEHVEATVFKAINAAISNRLGERSPWRTRFGLVVEDEDGNDDTVFAPLDWPTKPGHEEIGSRTLISERYICVKNEKLASKHGEILRHYKCLVSPYTFRTISYRGLRVATPVHHLAPCLYHGMIPY